MDFWNLMRRAANPEEWQERKLSVEFDALTVKVESYIDAVGAELRALSVQLASVRAELDALKINPPAPANDPAPAEINALIAEIDAAAANLGTVLTGVIG